VRKDATFAGMIPQRSATTKRVDFHCLRKSCARILIEVNVHPRVIQQRLRHSNIRLTMDLLRRPRRGLFRELTGILVLKMFVPSGTEAATAGHGNKPDESTVNGPLYFTTMALGAAGFARRATLVHPAAPWTLFRPHATVSPAKSGTSRSKRCWTRTRTVRGPQ